ncbi:c-type cytochrome [Cyclobacteriaceae bacterium]|nr:c-type cytochrome [Cyclobacteriaceae bacterium]
MRLSLIALFIVTIVFLLALRSSRDEKVKFVYPADWPKPTYNFKKNPPTIDGIALGRKLFYDPKLSRDSMISCASCHLSFTGFTHIDHKVSHGIEDRIGTRNTGSLINLAWQKSFMWDGSVNHLDFQPLAPLTNPVEMDADLNTIVNYLKSDSTYKVMFEKAFGKKAEINTPNMLKAFSQFMLQIKSFNSKYDKVKRGEDQFASLEAEGYELFKDNCASCHSEPLFTNQQFANNGLEVDPKYNDGGRIKVTGLVEDSLKFKVPTLRNIEVTYPYMHDGRFKSLQMVIHHYVHNVKQTPNLAPELDRPIILKEAEKRALIMFLKTLTDKEFLYNKSLSFPRT